MSFATRVRRPISDAELNRRWIATRQIMDKNDVDIVLTQGSNMHLGGYVRWFTDIPAEYNYNMTVLFPKDDEMTLVRTSGSKVPEWVLRGVKEIKYAPFCPTLTYTSVLEAGIIIDYLRAKAPKRVGYVGAAFITAGLMKTLLETFPNIEFVNFSNEIDRLKAIKSDEEMNCVRETARVHDALWSALPALLHEYHYEYQIRAAVCELVMNMGSEEHLLFMGTAKHHSPCGMPTFQYANRRIQPGDYGVLLLEVSGPGGYYCESARNFCFGDPYPELQAAWDACVEGQQMTADMLTPGRDAREIVARYNELMDRKGYSQEGRLYGHSQGYDLVERPAFMCTHPYGEEQMMVEVGMNCSLHPYLTDDEQTTYINDNYYVGPNGVEKLHKTPPKMIIV